MGKVDFLKGALFLVISYLFVDHLKHDERPIVETENGKVRGIISDAGDFRGLYKAFKGIPFAKSPINELRFESPEPPESWSGIRDAAHYGSQCISLDILFSGLMFGNEDCLFINVFVPIISHSYPLTTYFYIHGGYWHLGSSQDHGEKRLMGNDVILVTFNYRLGALGFLSTGDKNVGGVRGNMGLKDQLMALKWVQRNIKQFGGDPDRVTIAGESVGAASVHLHILSPASNSLGLFKRAIAQSGTALNTFSTYRKVKSQAKRFAAKFNCPTNDSAELKACLKKVDASTLVYAHKESFDTFRHRQTMFGPTIETINDSQAFMVEDPLTILERGDFPKIPLLMGVNAQEGSIFVAAADVNENKFKTMKNWRQGFPRLLHYPRNDTTSSKIHDYYFHNMSWDHSKQEVMQNLTNLLSDRFFFHASSKTARLYSKHAETYLYYFNYKTFVSVTNFARDSERLYHPVIGIVVNHVWRAIKEYVLGWPVISDNTCHGDEMMLLFSHWTPEIFLLLPERDKAISRNLVHLWTSFAKSWDNLIIDRVNWEPIDPNNRTLRYLEISNAASMIDEPFAERMEFWESIHKSLPEQ